MVGVTTRNEMNNNNNAVILPFGFVLFCLCFSFPV